MLNILSVKTYVIYILVFTIKLTLLSCYVIGVLLFPIATILEVLIWEQN